MKRMILLSALGMAVLAGSAIPPAGRTSAHAQASGKAPRGDTLFAQRCAMCHAMGGRGGKIGPDLTAIIGRKAASGSFAYSPALRKLGWTWTASTLDSFLAGPAKVAPGTRMPLAVSNPDDRKAIITYLSAPGK